MYETTAHPDEVPRTAPIRPRVTIHTVLSADGRTDVPTGYDPVVGRLPQDAVLAVAGTILAAGAAAGHDMSLEDTRGEPPPRSAPRGRPWLVVLDEHARIRRWNWLRTQPQWRDVLVVVTAATPADHLARLRAHRLSYVVAGDQHLDLGRLLAALAASYGITHLRVDGDGALHGTLLRAGLVDELSLVISPVLVGSGQLPHQLYSTAGLPAAEPVDLTLTHLEQLDRGAVWLRYRVMP